MLLAVRMLKKKLGAFTLSIDDLKVWGSIVRLAGPNGSGKTTLLKLISGVLKPDAGTIVVAGRDVTNMEPEKRKIPLITGPQSVIPYMKVIDNIRFAQNVSDKELDEIIRITGLRNMLLEKVGNLSDGLRVRVALGSALASNPKLLLVDEALDYLDSGYIRTHSRLLLDYIRSRGLALIYVTHHVSLDHDQLVVLENGKLAYSNSPPR
jgi:ABC-type multidrug transport system ATPase subunit